MVGGMVITRSGDTYSQGHSGRGYGHHPVWPSPGLGTPTVRDIVVGGMVITLSVDAYSQGHSGTGYGYHPVWGRLQSGT